MQGTGYVHANQRRNKRRPFAVEVRLETGTTQCAVACLLNKCVEAAPQRQRKSIGSGSDQADCAAKQCDVDNKIPEDHSPVGGREQIDYVLRACNAIC